MLDNLVLKSEDLQNKHDNKILKLINEDVLNSALEQLFNCYEQIILCHEMNLRGEHVASQFYDTDAKGFVNTRHSCICNVHKEWHNSRKYQKVT
jgi:hypothetical protein